MSETTPTRRPRTKKTEVIEDAVVIEDATPAEPDVVVVETPESQPTYEPAVESAPEPAPAATAPEPTGPQVVYVHTPPEPTRRGNRGIGAAIAVASGLIFLAVFVIAVALIGAASGSGSQIDFTNGTLYLPTLFFILGFVLLVVLANRANWWAYILGSVLVALLVYFGTIGAVMLANGAILGTPEEAAAMFQAGLVNPVVVAAALIAREVSLWTGSLIARRGRRLTVRNAEARTAWEREVAEKKAEYERTLTGSSAS